MSSTFEKFLYAGVGLALKGKEKVEEVARRVIEESKLGEEEGRRFIKEMVEKSEETRDEVRRMVEDQVRKTLKAMGMVSQGEVEKLEARIAALEKKAGASKD